MASEPKTTWERVNDLLRTVTQFPAPDEEPMETWNDHAVVLHFLCGELDDLRRKNSELERQLLEVATGEKR